MGYAFGGHPWTGASRHTHTQGRPTGDVNERSDRRSPTSPRGPALSKTAVSLVLNDRPGSRLSADAVARIHEAARELNYRPNPRPARCASARPAPSASSPTR